MHTFSTVGAAGGLVPGSDFYFPFEVLDDDFVVNDLVKAVDRRRKALEHAAERVDGHLHAGAEATGTCEEDLHVFILGREIGGPPWSVVPLLWRCHTGADR